MAMDFGKLNFYTSFNPASAFPLDARSYFESYDEAVAAAAQATAVGGSTSRYYYGQILVVVENEQATLYIIQPDNTLSLVTGANGETSITINRDLFEYDENNNLTLIGFNEAEAGSFFVKNEDGTVSWAQPIDAYTKTETDEKIAAAVADAEHLKRKIVASLEEAEEYMANNSDADQYIFMVPTGLQEDDDKYDEYVVIVVADVPTLEKVGSWSVDLSEYAKITDVEDALAIKVDAQEGYGLASAEQLEKLDNLQDPYITGVDTAYLYVESGILYLDDLPIGKVSGLTEILNSKVDAQEGYTLLSPTDQKKLDALVISDGNLEISGTVNAENVVNLAEWLNEHAGDTVGLSENNLTDELYSKLSSMLYISSVEEDELDVTDGHLSIITVDISKITGLQDALNAKASQAEVTDLADNVAGLGAMMTQHATTIATHTTEIEELWDSLTWQDIE